MSPRPFHFKSALLLLLVSAGALTGTWAALRVDFSQVVHGLMHAVGMRGAGVGSQHSQEITEVGEGNEVTVDHGVHRVTPIAPDQLAQRLAWAGVYNKGGRLIFRGQSLEIVVAEFNRHNGVQLRVGDPQTGRLQVGGSFQEEDVDGFVAALARVYGVKVTRPGEGVISLSGGHAPGSADIPGLPQP